MGEKGVFTEPVTWEEHFQGLREAVAETIKNEPGSPVAVQLLGMVRELVGVFPKLMEREDTRQNFLVLDVGDYPSFVLRRPLVWDWEENRPIYWEAGANYLEGVPGLPSEWQGARPANALETAAFSALSKGMAWFITAGRRSPVLFNRLQSLSPFPEGRPPTTPGVEVSWGFHDLNIARDITNGLGRPHMEFWAVNAYGPILPWGVTLGGGPLSAPKSFPFDDDLTQLLRVDAGAWSDLRFRGEIRGRVWESFFSITCRGLEVFHDQKVACLTLDISPTWGMREWKEHTDLETMTLRDAQLEEAMAMRTAALEWTREDWTTWADSVSASLTEAMDRLGGMGTRLQGHGVVESSGSANLTTEAQEGADTPSVSAVAMPQGVSALATVGEVSALGVEEVEPVLATYVTGEGFLSVRGGQQVKFLSSPAPDASKVKRLEDEWGRRLLEGEAILEETGTAPDWMEENRKRGAAGWQLTKKEKTRIREELGRGLHGVVEFGPGVEPRWVRIGEDSKGRRWEFHLGGQWRFLNESLRVKTLKALKSEDEGLALLEEKLEAESRGALFPPTEEIERTRKRRDLNNQRREALTSWGRAIQVLARLRAEQASQRQEIIEVDADTFKIWIWGTGEAPDNWLQTVRETLGMLLDISATVVGISQGAGASLIRYEYRTKDAPGKGQDAAKGSRGSNLVFLVTLNRALLGGIASLESGERTLPSGVKTLTFDTSEKNRREKKKEIEKVDQLNYSPEVHLGHFLDLLGESPETQRIGQTLADHITPAGAAVAKGWTVKPRGRKNPDGSMERQYTRRFCDLIPEGAFFHGALGSFVQTPENGWKMGGRHNELRRTNYSLLEFMGLDLPQGANESGRREVYLQGLKALLRVVVEWGDGILAVKLSEKWYDLGTPMEEAKLLHLLKEGRIFPFFSPGWLDKVRAAYETKTNLRLPKSRDEADAARWKKPTDEKGFPFHVQFKATLERRGLTQAQAAGELGVTQKTVSVWLSGKKTLSPETAAKVREWMEKDKGM
jgi:DNA-binding XRE family transcriptional regulator